VVVTNRYDKGRTPDSICKTNWFKGGLALISLTARVNLETVFRLLTNITWTLDVLISFASLCYPCSEHIHLHSASVHSILAGKGLVLRFFPRYPK
jgi:hypothetical protein